MLKAVTTLLAFMSLSPLRLDLVQPSAGAIASAQPIEVGVIEISVGVVVVCSSYSEIVRLDAIISATGRDDGSGDGCWNVRAPARFIILGETLGFSSVTYWEEYAQRWYPGQAWTKTNWLF